MAEKNKDKSLSGCLPHLFLKNHRDSADPHSEADAITPLPWVMRK